MWILAGSLFMAMAASEANATVCSGATGSHSDEARCEWRIEREAQSRMVAELNKAVAAAQSLDRTQAAAFVSQILNAQAIWRSSVRAQCSLEAEATMGTAAITVEPICRQRLDEDRQKWLRTLAQELTDAR